MAVKRKINLKAIAAKARSSKPQKRTAQTMYDNVSRYNTTNKTGAKSGLKSGFMATKKAVAVNKPVVGTGGSANFPILKTTKKK